VYKLNEGEMIVVPFNDLNQPVKSLAGLFTRFMILLVKEPKLCPLDAKNWKECKKCCSLKLIMELRIGIRALSYRELGCISDMSNSDELRHTDNTTLVPLRLPNTLLQVYHRRCPTLGLLILPSISPFPLTIRCTTRISVLPIKPNLAERARISAINLDDYQLDPVTPPPSPSSPFSMAAYQRMIAETDPT
ncbi:hypothetical protein Tco_1402035, partial [Tanacetum coccineum]